MKTHVSATIIDGLIKPDQSLGLPNLSRVNVTVELAKEATDSENAWAELIRRLDARPVYADEHYTRDQLHERN